MKYIIILLGLCLSSFSETKEYSLNISEQEMNPAGKVLKTLTVNGGIPGPTLKFKLGDTAKITVYNKLKNEDTSIHWHGLLLPNKMDGVPYLTTTPIKPGKSYTFEFELKHPGTYWYHSHTGLQEQRGVYGSIVIENPDDPVKADREHVVVLSDWTNENPNEVMRTLMRGDEWYAIKKGNTQSIWGAFKNDSITEYFNREWVRMPPMDVSDVAYDAFWMNGKPKIKLDGKPGEKVRLRIINAGASTYFYLTSGVPITIVASDGPEVQPVRVNKLLIGMAETYDLVMTIPENGAVELRATSQDGSGFSSAIIGNGKIYKAKSPPKPDLYNMDQMLMDALDNNMDGMSERPMAPYKKLKSLKSTEYKSNLPRRKITLRLTGDMTRYIWSFNGKTLAEDSMIKIKKGEVLQIEMINDTMMHHPIHLHGHFFRLLNGNGNLSPLKHTVDVHPMGKRSIEFEANDVGDWFFHCHLLYHMDAGMARVISYEELGKDHKPKLDPNLLEPWFFMMEGSVMDNMTMGRAKTMTGREDFYIDWDIGYKDHYMYEVDAAWSHYFNQNLSTFLGYRWTNDMESKDRPFAGFTYRLPLLIESSVSLDGEGYFRLGLGKEFQVTDRWSISNDLEYDTNTEWEWVLSSEYRFTKMFSLAIMYSTDHDWGFGLKFRF